jgi:hypothetical protein
MTTIVEYLKITYSLCKQLSESELDYYLANTVLPEINSIREDDPSFYSTIPSQAKPPQIPADNVYFECETAFGDFWGESYAALEDVKRYQLSEETITWTHSTMDQLCHLTRYLAWKVFTEFGVGDTFTSEMTTQSIYATCTDISVVDRNAIEVFI